MKKRKYPDWMMPELFQLLMFALGTLFVLGFIIWVITTYL